MCFSLTYINLTNIKKFWLSRFMGNPFINCDKWFSVFFIIVVSG